MWAWFHHCTCIALPKRWLYLHSYLKDIKNNFAKFMDEVRHDVVELLFQQFYGEGFKSQLKQVEARLNMKANVLKGYLLRRCVFDNKSFSWPTKTLRSSPDPYTYHGNMKIAVVCETSLWWKKQFHATSFARVVQRKSCNISLSGLGKYERMPCCI